MGKSFKRILTIMLTLCLFLSTVGVAAGADTSITAPNITVENDFDGIRINWTDVSGASNYEVLRKGADEETETVIATVTSTSYTDTEVLAGYKYYYKVKAVAANGGSAVCQPESIRRSLYFGAYEQDNDLSNGKEPIEWLVKKIEDGKMFIVSKYCLDAHAYNDEFTDVTWETSTIRTWLNEDFFKAAFSAEEQAEICDTSLTNGANFTYKTPGGNDTVDKVFLLSLSEVRSTFPTDAERVADATAYALAQGTNQYDDNGSSMYWTRTPGYTADCAVYVCGEGATYFSGFLVNNPELAVRPAIWVEAKDAVAQEDSSSGLAAPAINAANVADGVRVSWTSVSDAVRYAVYRRTSTETYAFVASVTDLSYVDSTVTKGNEYFYQVRAYDSDGNYALSIGKGIVAQPTTDAALTAPVLALEKTANGILVRWTSEPGAVEYKVYRKVNIIGDYELVKTTTDLAYMDNNTVNGTSYYYKVRAMDSEGNYRTCRSRGLAAAADGSGTDVSFEINAVNQEAGIRLTWPAVDGASQYTVSRKVVGEADYTQLATAIENNYLDKTAKAGVKYSYSVSAIAGGSSVASATETVDRTVFFGSYEQDNITENGAEPIEWIVLDVQDDQMLLISRLNLDLCNFNEEYTDVTWENSTLRAWLNDGFMNKAFTASEQAVICNVNLANEDNPVYQTDGGNSTVDKVFVLSISETDQYFGADGDRQADTSEYCKTQGAYPNSDFGTSWYWLRTPGYAGNYFTFISGNGHRFICGNTVHHAANAVRPAIWISTKEVVTPIPEEDEIPAAEETYTVAAGDCLWNIARKVYGNGAKWPVIFEANKNTIKNTNLIYVGQKLVIPSL